NPPPEQFGGGFFFYGKYGSRNESAARRAVEARKESLGSAGRHTAFCARGVLLNPARVDWYLLPMVGRLYPGGWRGRCGRPGRRRQGSPVLHGADPHSKRHPQFSSTTDDR